LFASQQTYKVSDLQVSVLLVYAGPFIDVKVSVWCAMSVTGIIQQKILTDVLDIF
jgi:hypothetical protein